MNIEDKQVPFAEGMYWLANPLAAETCRLLVESVEATTVEIILEAIVEAIVEALVETHTYGTDLILSASGV
jgi:hypothetical protein